MVHEKTQAIVLRGVDFSETSRIVTFLTPGRGRLACMAKGARRKGSSLGSCVVNLNHVEIVYQHKAGREVQALAEATLLNGFRSIRMDAHKGFYAAFPGEIALRVAQVDEPNEALFQALVRGLEELEEWKGDVRTHAVWQAWQLLGAAGHQPVLDRTMDTGAAPPVTPAFSYDGGVVSGGPQADARLNARQFDELRLMVEARERCPLQQADPALFRLVWHYARRQLDCDFRSARVLQDMYG